MKLGLAIREVADAERELAGQLLTIGERHRSDHDVYHLTRQLARWSERHLAALAGQGQRYGVDLDAGGVDGEVGGPLAAVREKASELLGRQPASGLLLLHDLRHLHLLAAEASLDWTMLAQAAKAAKDEELLRCASLCHPDTLRTLRWTVTKVKSAAPQVLTS